MYQLKETLFDKFDSFNILYTDEQQLLRNVASFDFEPIFVREDGFKDIETRWIGKHVPISVSFSSNLLQDPIFICNSNPLDLVSSFVVALENLAAQSKAQMRMSFLEVENAIKMKLAHLMELLNERRSRRKATFTSEDECCEADSVGKDVSTQFLHMQKKQLIQWQEHFERYDNVLPVFGFNSGRYDINLIKKYLLPLLVEDKDIEPIVIKKTNQYMSFRFGDVHFLGVLNFLGGATNLESFLKAYKTEEIKCFCSKNGSMTRRNYHLIIFHRMNAFTANCAIVIH